MADRRTAYGAKVSLVLTSLTSLANGSAWRSDVLDFSTAKFLDALIRLKLNGAASGTALVDIFIAASVAADGTYDDGATAGPGAFTAASRKNAKYIGSIQMNAATGVMGHLTIAQAFGGVLPQKCILILVNSSGAALSATGGDHGIDVEPIYETIA